VLAREVLGEPVGVGFGRARDRKLERLSSVAELVYDVELGVLHLRAGGLAELGDERGEPVPVHLLA
jgi:hypothetical protein